MPLRLRAQAPPGASPTATEQPAKPAADAAPSSVGVPPLSRFVARDNLIFYAEFAGLETHAEPWKKTAAQRMINETSLGRMLEEVFAQLLDRWLSSAPNRKVNGAELVSLAKLAVRNGCVIAVNSGAKTKNPLVGTLVIRGATTKEQRPLTARLLGTLMGPEAKPKIERKEGRVLVVVPDGTVPEDGFVWWPEKNDLVVGFMQPQAETIIAVLDGKVPSAADHAALSELAKPEGGFAPLLRLLIDPATIPATPVTKLTELASQARLRGGEAGRVTLGVRGRRPDERHPIGGSSASQAAPGDVRSAQARHQADHSHAGGRGFVRDDVGLSREGG